MSLDRADLSAVRIWDREGFEDLDGMLVVTVSPSGGHPLRTRFACARPLALREGDCRSFPP